jgi:hypothetical protein
MMKIIALHGPKNCGKTTTLRLVYSKLLTIAQIRKPAEPIPGAGENDLQAEFELDGLNIGVYTEGDFNKVVYVAVQRHPDVDILIIAMNDAFKGNRAHDPFEFIKQYPYRLIQKIPQPPENRETDNERIANEIIALVKSNDWS